MSTCAVCKKELGTGITRSIGEGRNRVEVCMSCNPFRRCGAIVAGAVCLGIMQSASTPNDMGRSRCDVCGRKGRL